MEALRNSAQCNWSRPLAFSHVQPRGLQTERHQSPIPSLSNGPTTIPYDAYISLQFQIKPSQYIWSSSLLSTPARSQMRRNTKLSEPQRHFRPPSLRLGVYHAYHNNSATENHCCSRCISNSAARLRASNVPAPASQGFHSFGLWAYLFVFLGNACFVIDVSSS